MYKVSPSCLSQIQMLLSSKRARNSLASPLLPKVILYNLSSAYLSLLMGNSSTMYPFLIIETLSQSVSTSEKICVERRIVFPLLLSFLSNCMNASCITGSSPEVGSSKINISGSCIKATTIASFLLFPKLILFVSPLGSSSKSSINFSTRESSRTFLIFFIISMNS